MQLLSAHGILDLWDRVASCAPSERGLAILASAAPDATPDAWTIGECEEKLLALHQALFGNQLNGYAECPRCGESLELGVSIPELRSSVTGGTFADTLEYREYVLRYRLLTGADLLDAGACASVSQARQLLLERAVVSVVRRGRPVGIARLPRGLVDRLAERLADGDAWAESLLALECPACRHEWSVLLDTAVFVWTAVRSRAQRLVHDVHTLARAYGWREADILAMSTRRREAYLELVGA
jgi:hypothetical protein